MEESGSLMSQFPTDDRLDKMQFSVRQSGRIYCMPPFVVAMEVMVLSDMRDLRLEDSSVKPPDSSCSCMTALYPVFKKPDKKVTLGVRNQNGD